MTNEWYHKLKSAGRASIEEDEDMENLLVAIRKEGVYGLGSSGLREASATLLQEQGTHFSNAVRWLFKRLQDAGLPPSYPRYVGTEVLNAWGTEAVGNGQVAKNTIRLIYELLAYLLEVPELQDHPRRVLLEQRVQKIMEKCREHSFSSIPPDTFPADVAKVTLLPESPVSDELIFLRVVQSTELVFNAAAKLTARTLESIAYSDAVDAMVALHWTICLESLLLPLLRLLAPMSVEHWLEFRPLIVRPSAIQSINFHSLCTQLNELNRILNHPRYAEGQHVYLSGCQDLLKQASKTLSTWYKAHTRIAAKYGQALREYKPEGVRWLETQHPIDGGTVTAGGQRTMAEEG